MCRVIIIVAVANNGVMGYKGGMPWHYPEDLKRFKRVTMGHPIVMGRKTWESLPNGPLPGRENIVLTRNPHFKADGCIIYKDIKPIIFDYNNQTIYVIGGAEIFKSFIEYADEIDLCHIDKSFIGDVFWPNINITEWDVTKVISGEDNDLLFITYEKIKHP